MEMGCTEKPLWGLGPGEGKVAGGAQAVNRGAGGKTAARLLLRVG